VNTPSVIDRTVGHENTRNWERPGGSRDPENSTTTTLVTYGQLNQWDFGGSVWESNLLGADSSSTYEEGFGLNWKDLPSFGILNAAFLPPRIFIPLFSSEEPFQRLDCWPPASHRAPLACKCSLMCECPNAAEVLLNLQVHLQRTKQCGVRMPETVPADRTNSGADSGRKQVIALNRPRPSWTPRPIRAWEQPITITCSWSCLGLVRNQKVRQARMHRQSPV
jgi:hypothetical protein